MEKYMKVAYSQALKAFNKNEIPVGAVIVKNGKIIAKAKNNRQNNKNVTGHAEINAIIKAEKKLKDWRLDGCEMFVTLKPCKMCETIIKESRIDKVYYLISQPNLNYKNKIIKQTNDCKILKEKYQQKLNEFFEILRK